jgi:UDP-glucose 4-epimerase
MKKTILVTGGLGYIGSHTVMELIKASYDTIIVDNLSNSYIVIHENIKKTTGADVAFYQVDAGDSFAMQAIFEKHRPSVVIHFAAYKSIVQSVLDPLVYFKNNLCSLINILAVMNTCKTGRLVFSSSATVYGNPETVPVTENTPIQKATSAYGSTKQMGEEIIENVTRSNGIDAIALRYFNPVGAHPSGMIGELPKGIPNNLFPFLMQTAAGKLSKLTVFGNHYDTSDGSCVRDYIHVVDLARAHVRACERLLSKDPEGTYSVYNIGTGKGTSVLEVISAFREITGIEVPFCFGPPRKGDVASIYADASKVFRELAWKAELGLKEMIDSAWRWQCSQKVD